MSEELGREILRRFEGPLLRYAGRILHDDERARDVVQDTFLAYWRTRQPGQNHQAAWLFRVCRNRALDIRRKEMPMKPLDENDVAAVLGAEPLPDAVLEDGENGSELLLALSSISQDQQEAIRLKVQEGLSYREISEITGHSVSNVGFLIHAGLKALRHKLKARRLS